jgi:cellulose synthase/poly-beta-1,6-N-acetylglucosamine synthase-like glycosyltransferase
MTYRIRQQGWLCRVSPLVPAYTDSMKTIRALWHQRMKWQVGTVHDLLIFGFNRLTARDWAQQALGMLNALIRALWLALWIASASVGDLHFQWTWWAFPLFFSGADFFTTLRLKERDNWDLLIAASLFPMELFAWMRAAWFVASWWKILSGRSGMNDLWAAQYAVDGTD